MMKILIYVLYGMWNTSETDGVVVIKVSVDVEPLIKKLDEIADNQANEYVEMHGYIHEERGKRYYEAVDASGKYVKFYITEQQLELSESMMRTVSRETGNTNRTRDVKQYLDDMYEEGNIEVWKYEYMTREPAVMQEILTTFDKIEDCNTPFNTTMDIVVGNVMSKVTLDDKKLEFLWKEFGDILVDNDGGICNDFLGFERGTHWEEVWNWFDERHSKGVAYLIT